MDGKNKERKKQEKKRILIINLCHLKKLEDSSSPRQAVEMKAFELLPG